MEKFNNKIAKIIATFVGNMWFFWAALLFVIILRSAFPPEWKDVLLDIENDLQLLILAAMTVVQNNQQKHSEKMLFTIQSLEAQLLLKVSQKVCVCPKKEKIK